MIEAPYPLLRRAHRRSFAGGLTSQPWGRNTGTTVKHLPRWVNGLDVYAGISANGLRKWGLRACMLTSVEAVNTMRLTMMERDLVERYPPNGRRF